MATPRRSSSRTSKASKKTTRPAKASKKSTAASRTGRATASRSEKPPVAKRGKEVKTAKGPVPKGKEAVKGKGAREAAHAKGARKKAAAPPPEVRPLGVLPPGSMARSNPRPAVASVHPTSGSGSRVAVPPPGSTGAQRVTEADLKEFEQRLLADRQKILKEMGHLENTVLKINQRDSAGDLSGYSFHMADVGTDAMEREKAFLFASAEGRTLLEINEALRRLYRGEYGTCESCSQPIARARLEAMPHARLCLPCKAKEERASRGAV